MISSCRGIVFQTHNYSESSVIAKIYTSELGLQSFLINGVRSKSGAIRPSHLMPLNLLQMVIYHRQNAQLHRVKELKCEPVLVSLHFDRIKSSLAMFIKEVLSQCVVEEERNIELFEFLWNAIQWLDIQTTRQTNFPAFFLIQLSRYLGFYPSGEWKKGHHFSLMDGTFHASGELGAHSLDEDESRMMNELRDVSFEHYHELEYPASLRRPLLNSLNEYYRLHLTGFRSLQSPEVLHEVLK